MEYLMTRWLQYEYFQETKKVEARYDVMQIGAEKLQWISTRQTSSQCVDEVSSTKEQDGYFLDKLGLVDISSQVEE